MTDETIRRGSYADHAEEFPAPAPATPAPATAVHEVRYLRPDGVVIWRAQFDAARALDIPRPPEMIRGPYRVEIRPVGRTDAP